MWKKCRHKKKEEELLLLRNIDPHFLKFGAILFQAVLHHMLVLPILVFGEKKSSLATSMMIVDDYPSVVRFPDRETTSSQLILSVIVSLSFKSRAYRKKSP